MARNSTHFKSRINRIVKLTCALMLMFITSQSNAQTTITAGTLTKGYSLNTSAIYVDPALTVTASSAISGVKVTISAGLKANDVLAYTGTLPAGVSATAYNSTTGVLAFSGSASAANWETFLRTITFSNTVTSQLGDRTVTFSAGALSSFSNGHFYELVTTGTNWGAAKTAAAARTYQGYTGYLATITSSAENAFIKQVLAADAWVGGSDDFNQINAATGVTTYANQTAAEGNWFWVTGPEKGTKFSVGNGTPVTQSGQYANWAGSEPNNSGGEHYCEVYSSSATAAWNDLPNGSSLGYVVEYGGLASDPAGDISSNTVIYINIAANTISSAQNICYNASATALTGSTPTGGTGSYTYLWQASTTSATSGFATATGTSNGSGYTPGALTGSAWYRRVVTSGSGTDTTSAIKITVNPQLSSGSSSSNVSCNGGSNGVASLNVTGGTSSYSYLWNGGATTSSRTGLAAGSYTVTITDANSCTLSQSFTITQPSALAASTSQTNIACNGGSTGVAAVTTSGGTASYTYLWNNGSTAASTAALVAGAYTCTITDANSCTVSKSFTITQPTALSVSKTTTNVACNGGSNGAASVTASNGTPGYTYLWNGGATTSSRTGLTAGNYTCTVTDANGCTSVQTFTVTQPSALSSGASSSNVSCNGGSNGVASLNVTGGTSSYSYLWNGGATTSSRTGLAAGSYTVTITDANSCTLSQSFTITQPSALAASTSQTNILCNGGSNGTAAVTASGGTAAYTYLWNNGSTAASTSSLVAGAYTCTITDANSCTVSKAFTITQPTALSVSKTTTNVSCNGGSNGVASVTATNGTPGYTYLWNGGATTSARTGLAAGNYTCTVTDANGCTSVQTFTVTQPSALSSGQSSTNVSCNGGSNGVASLNVTGGTSSYSYLWNGGATTSSRTGLAAGSYTVTITDANSCTLSQSFTITQPSALAASTSQSNITCNGAANGTASVSPSGGTTGYTYLWSNGNTTSAISSLVPGNYTCTITDGNMCTVLKTVSITQPTVLSATTSQVNVSCNSGSNGTASVLVSGGSASYAYSWSPSGGTASTATGLSAGSYTCEITDANGCSLQKLFNVSEPAAIVSSYTTVEPLCNGSEGSASLIASGGTGTLVYEWSTGGTSDTENNLVAGNYTVTITDDNGCADTKNITINQPLALSGSVVTDSVSCHGETGSAMITANGGTGLYTYLWSTGDTTDTAVSLPAGIYSVNITDENGCTYSTPVNVAQPDSIVISSSTVSPLCNSGTGSASVIVAGGTGMMTYSWSNGDTTDVINNVTADDYTIVVTDENGCTQSSVVTVSEPDSLTITTTVGADHCGQSDGTISVATTGGAGAFTYLWDNANIDSTRIALTADIYNVTVTDANGCSKAVAITLNAIGNPTTIENVTNVTCHGSADGTALLFVPTGSGHYTYSWSNGETTIGLFGLTGGTYTYTVTDDFGCSMTDSITVTEPSALSLSSVTTNELQGSDGTIDLTVSGGTQGYDFSWSNGSIDEDLNGLVAGNYTVTVTDANGCSSSEIFTVSSSVGIADADGKNISVSIYPNPNKGTFLIEGLQRGTYQVTDATGRIISDFAMLTAEKKYLELNNLSDGVYYLKSVKSDKNISAKFIVIK